MEDWAEIRRLHRAEGVPIKEIARRLGVARNTVKAALASDRPLRLPQRGIRPWTPTAVGVTPIASAKSFLVLLASRRACVSRDGSNALATAPGVQVEGRPCVESSRAREICGWSSSLVAGTIAMVIYA